MMLGRRRQETLSAQIDLPGLSSCGGPTLHHLIKSMVLEPLHRGWRLPGFLRRWLLKLALRMQSA
jgi:hypothetical protein